jgi:hypothetical protein
MVNAPMAQVTRAPATISFKVFLFIVISPSGMFAARKLAAVECSAWFAKALPVVAVRTPDGTYLSCNPMNIAGRLIPRLRRGAPSPACCMAVR